MSVTVLLMSLLVERLWVVLPKSPYFASLYSLGLTFGIMLFGGVIAFFMVRLRSACLRVAAHLALSVTNAHMHSCGCHLLMHPVGSVMTRMVTHACPGVDGV